jgi:hypothetical protein
MEKAIATRSTEKMRTRMARTERNGRPPALGVTVSSDRMFGDSAGSVLAWRFLRVTSLGGMRTVVRAHANLPGAAWPRGYAEPWNSSGAVSSCSTSLIPPADGPVVVLLHGFPEQNTMAVDPSSADRAGIPLSGPSPARLFACSADAPPTTALTSSRRTSERLSTRVVRSGCT